MDESTMTRRGLIKTAGIAGVGGLTGLLPGATDPIEPQRTHPTMVGVPFERHEKVRLGIIGVGGRGTGVCAEFLAVPGVEVRAVCDVVPAKTARAAAMVQKAGQPKPAEYHAGDHDYENLCKRDDLDLVYIATPWIWHVRQALSALEHGHHVGVEVPAARTLAECWELVDASEKARRHCMIFENCCYGETELMVLRMVRAGLLGELTHGAGAYNHDLRALLFEDQGEGLWRRAEHLDRNGNLYPTHGLGPVANYLDCNRGDRFDYMVSMSSPSVGLQAFRKEHLRPDDPKMREVYHCGDQNTSLIKTVKGRLITVEHNVSEPHPYDRINLIAGTKGIFRDYPPRLYIDGQKEGEQFVGLDAYKAQFEHPLWAQEGEVARKSGGHGGMDYIMCWRVIQCMREGLAPDFDVYDAAAWSAPGPLSEHSVAHGSAPVKFPDFTRGNWQKGRAFAGV
ncbi:Gfo/Idh/MocA family protein [Fimbriimonas ginsengisoli]|uniref:Glycosyl hydrolase family 109 protein n=1 Tax=Fimbriimonas ginsengisoli Gsoil 348 TaxID=661478 RepID=A0A068NK40_FIMGI|nr:Gfo/Idh/MocA family oxidoreductase [Fimbriimonas ginsengisoli]AIE83953.1 oxidoreductase domain protein [Fimbriimonas ginsengisoli Gsoil 348]